jgi:hypothetical protein
MSIEQIDIGQLEGKRVNRLSAVLMRTRRFNAAEIDARMRALMIAATLLVIPDLVFEEQPLRASWHSVAAIGDWAIWLVFLVELAAIVVLARDRRTWLRSYRWHPRCSSSHSIGATRTTGAEAVPIAAPPPRGPRLPAPVEATYAGRPEVPRRPHRLSRHRRRHRVCERRESCRTSPVNVGRHLVGTWHRNDRGKQDRSHDDCRARHRDHFDALRHWRVLDHDWSTGSTFPRRQSARRHGRAEPRRAGNHGPTRRARRPSPGHRDRTGARPRPAAQLISAHRRPIQRLTPVKRGGRSR